MLLCVTGACRAEHVTGHIGSHKLTYETRRIATSADFDVASGARYLAVTEVYPDTPDEVVYTYGVYSGGRLLHERRHTGLGFGPTTYFIKFSGKAPGSVRFRNTSKTPLLISSARSVTDDMVRGAVDRDRFAILGLVSAAAGRDEQSRLAKMLSDRLGERPDLGIGRGFSYEVTYANRGADDVRGQIDSCRAWSDEHGLPALIGLVSWWSGTPLQVPDGHGGRFGDLKYQQICYSPDAEVSENEELKKLLGARYNRHFGLSTPNIWSNTPWLTMNSPELNDYRCSRLGEAIGLLREFETDKSRLAGVYVENEPRYWDTDCEAGNPKSNRKLLWADFNPLTIADAAKDGVDLDPRDGLSNEELAWLHRNVGSYYQQVVDAARNALNRVGASVCLYTHSLQHRSMFPGLAIKHPASEWAYAKGARTGIEGMWSQVSDYERVREWGPWANVDREENDGRDIALHLWDLRASYVMGADLYNSYNWHAIGADRFFAYVSEFLAALPVASSGVAMQAVNGSKCSINAPMNMQAFTGIELLVETKKPFKGRVILRAAASNGDFATSVPLWLELPAGLRSIRFEFANAVESRWDQPTTFELVAPAGIAIFGGSAKITLDLRTQRALSSLVIGHF